MLQTKKYQFWFCTGSQDLYGDECLAKVAEHSHTFSQDRGCPERFRCVTL